MKRILIDGSGRAGTSFLVMLLTRLGVNTGFLPYEEDYRSGVRGGCEIGVTDLDMWNEVPKVVKSPMFIERNRADILGDKIKFKHVIIPVRDIEKAARSRIQTGIGTGTTSELEQTKIIAKALGVALEVCTLKEIPMTTMIFPRLVEDEDYCYQKLSEVFKLNRKKFEKVFKELANPSQIVFK